MLAADHQNPVLYALCTQMPDRVCKHVQPFFHDETTQKADHDLLIRNSLRLPPRCAATRWREDGGVNPACPDADPLALPLGPHQLRHRRDGARTRSARV